MEKNRKFWNKVRNEWYRKEEVKKIYNQYNEFPTAMQGLGYKEVVEYLKNECTYEQMVEKIKIL